MSWSGVKRQSIKAEIEAWCEKMGIENYTINSQGEIDVDTRVNLRNKNFEELPYKFGRVIGYFDVGSNPNLTSLKNCPNYIEGSFDVDGCAKLDSLEGCPKEIDSVFYCRNCKQKFTEEEVKYWCKVKRDIWC